MRRWYWGAATITLVCAACASNDQLLQNRQPNQEAVQNMPFHFSKAVRERLSTHFDVDAAERVASMLNATERASFLQPMGISATGEIAAVTGPATNDVYYMMSHSDPRVQAELDKMWAPFWDQLPPEALDQPSAAYPFPGRAAALARRQAKLKLDGGKP